MKEISRRDFVKGAAAGAVVVAGAGLLSGCGTSSKSQSNLPDSWDDEADIIVVGSGGGLGGAVLAREAGMDVIVLEKTEVIGGSTAMHSGVVSCGGGTSIQQAAGIEDSPEEYYKFLMACARNQADPDLVKALAYKIPETYEWLVSLGAQFSTDWLYDSGPSHEPYYANITKPCIRGALYPLSEGVSRTGPVIHGFVQSAAEAKGVRLLLNTAATELITDADNRVVGVIAESDGTVLNYKARKGVLLAGGGFAYNKEMLKRLVRFGEMRMGVGGPGATGDGIRMGQKVGGDVRNMNETLRSPTTAVALGTTTRGKERDSFPSILVNMFGQRFVNEDYHSDTVGNAGLSQEEGIVYQIFDDSVIGAVSERVLPAVVEANTIEELAGMIGVDPAGLAATISAWNANAKDGNDPLFGKTGPTVAPIVKAPFHAFSVTTVYLVVTYGGLRVNDKCQVLDPFDTPITGLYAAGLDAGGWLGRLYPGSGTAVSGTYTMARIACEDMTQAASWEE